MAEDNLVNQKLASLLLRKFGLEPTLVSNGVAAVESVMNNQYDLVFMDVFMPEMDGTEATRVLKKELGDSCPYIVALTAANMEGEREKFLEAGMDEYLPKPLSRVSLEAFFTNFLSRQQTSSHKGSLSLDS